MDISSHQTRAMDDRPPPKGLGRTAKGSSRRWGRCYDNQALFPTFGVSDYESLFVKLAEIGVRPHRDDLDRACVRSLAPAARRTRYQGGVVLSRRLVGIIATAFGERSLKQPGDLEAKSDKHHASTDKHRSDEDFHPGLAAAESF